MRQSFSLKILINILEVWEHHIVLEKVIHHQISNHSQISLAAAMLIAREPSFLRRTWLLAHGSHFYSPWNVSPDSFPPVLYSLLTDKSKEKEHQSTDDMLAILRDRGANQCHSVVMIRIKWKRKETWYFMYLHTFLN